MKRPFSRREAHVSGEHAKSISLGAPVALLGLLLPLLAGCPGSLGPGPWNINVGAGGTVGAGGAGGAGPPPPPPCDAPTLHFKSTDPVTGCGLAFICHDADGASFSKLNLVDANPWQRLLNTPATSMDGTACMGMPLVDGTNRGNSVIIKRVNGDGCGKDTVMPLGIDPPNQTVIDCITGWVFSQ